MHVRVRACVCSCTGLRLCVRVCVCGSPPCFGVAVHSVQKSLSENLLIKRLLNVEDVTRRKCSSVFFVCLFFEVCVFAGCFYVVLKILGDFWRSLMGSTSQFSQTRFCPSTTPIAVLMIPFRCFLPDQIHERRTGSLRNPSLCCCCRSRENRIDPCCRRLQLPCLDLVGSSMKERRGGTEKDSRKGGKKKKGAREERKREPNSCPSSFKFLSVTERMSAVWLNALAPTQRRDLHTDILDESDFTFSLMKSERGSFDWKFKEAEKIFRDRKVYSS